MLRSSAGTQLPIHPLVLPQDHPHARPGLQKNSGSRDGLRSSSRKPIEIFDEEQQRPDLYEKTKSSVSLKSLLTGDKEKKGVRRAKASDTDVEKKPKKSKSATSLSAIFSRPKSFKGHKDTQADHDKENQTPPTTADSTSAPIWAQYARQIPESVQSVSKIPLNDSHEVVQEISLYTPGNYSPSKQRNFHDYSTPTLMHKSESKPRPKSDSLPPSPSSNAFIGTLSRSKKRSTEITRDQEPDGQPTTRGSSRRSSLEIALSIVRRPSQEKSSETYPRPQAPTPKRSSRVMAAVAALQGKNREMVQAPEAQKPMPSPVMDPKAIDEALEKLLVRQSQYLSIDNRVS